MTWADERIREANCHGTLTIDGISMNRGSWAVLNNNVWWNGADRLGEDTIVGGREGSLANPRYKTVTKHTLELLVVGTVDRNNVRYENTAIGLEENWEWLEVNVLDTVFTTIGGGRTAVLTLPSGRTRTGGIHIEGYRVGTEIQGALTATIEVSIPQGQLGRPEAP